MSARILRITTLKSVLVSRFFSGKLHARLLAKPSYIRLSWVVLVLALLSQPATAQNATFGCDNGKSYLFKSTITDIYQIDLTGGGAVATPLTTGGIPIVGSDGTTSTPKLQLNCFGYNSNDNYIWGQVYNQSQLVRIGSDYKGILYSVPSLPGKPYVVGDVNKDGIMYLAIGGSNADSQIYIIDLKQASLTATTLTTTLSYITDWAVSPIDGNLYAIHSSLGNGKPAALTLYRFLTADRTNADNSTTPAGTRESLGEVSGGSPAISNSNFGSAFMDISGSFYVVVNSTEAIYRIDSPDKLAVNGNPSATYIGTPSSVPNDINTDGARCAFSSVKVLPVALTSFWAAPLPRRRVQLGWTTASERNNDFFEVQYSLDGQAFAAVGRVAGHQTTVQASAYSFVDATPGAAATHYYRLRQVDLNGTSTFSPVQAVSLATAPWQLSVAPNPTTAEDLRVQVIAADPAAAVLEVRSLLGQCLYKQAVALQAGPNQLVLSTQLAPGMYWLGLTGEHTSGAKGIKIFLTK